MLGYDCAALRAVVPPAEARLGRREDRLDAGLKASSTPSMQRHPYRSIRRQLYPGVYDGLLLVSR